MTANGPYQFHSLVRNVWVDEIKTPTAWYKPHWADLDAPNLPANFMVTWNKGQSNGLLFRCIAHWFQDDVHGRIEYAEKMQIKFIVVWLPWLDPDPE